MEQKPSVSAIRVTVVADRPETRRSLEALIGGTPGYSVLAVHRSGDELLAAIEADPCDVLLVQLTSFDKHLELIRRLAARLPALRQLALAADPGDEAMLELVRAGADGCLPARHTPPARVLDAIAELHRGGAPLGPRLAAALVRDLQAGAAASSGTDPRPRVSRRETELLRLLAHGHSYKTAAAELGLSIDTVRFHLRNLYAKLHVHSKVEAVLRGLRDGLV